MADAVILSTHKEQLRKFLIAEGYHLARKSEFGVAYYLDIKNNSVVLDNSKYYYYSSFSKEILYEGDYTDIDQFIRDYRLNNILR